MTPKHLLLLTTFPPPEAFFEVHGRLKTQSDPYVILLAGEGVRNEISDSSQTYYSEIDLQGRGMIPREGALSDDEAAFLLLSVPSVMTFT